MLDARKHILGKLLVRSDFRLRRGDTDMGFIDTGARRLWRTLVLEDIAFVGGWVPEAGVVDGGDGEFLGDARDPGGDALLSGVVVGCDEGDLRQMLVVW
jgi:hypothetical protein